METYTLPQWGARRIGGECREALERIAASIPLGEALSYGPILVVKLLATGLARTFGEKPTFAQLEGIDPETARILDSADKAIRADDLLSGITSFSYGYWYKFAASCDPAGNVWLSGGFFGRDP